jgi:NTE family protein
MPEGQALVLGGGGVAGIAWMTGTSAGAAVAAQVGSGLPLDALLARQVDPAPQAPPRPARPPAGRAATAPMEHRTA